MRLASLQDLYTLLRTAKNNGEKVRIVRGNTSTGVYEPPPANLLVDISQIPELTKVSVGDNGIAIGGAVTITEFMNLLDVHKDLSPSYEPLLKHLKRVCEFRNRFCTVCILYFFTGLFFKKNSHFGKSSLSV